MIDNIIVSLAYRLPRRLAYWCFIRVATAATVGKYSSQQVPMLTVVDAAKRWSQ